ncbi:ribosome hibernation factor-recruiting GTPase MRF [Blastococcus saxobsidens]|uniref:G3E family GTPase n=1 Tax=Blastococcus saxobsidens TaxID=138336 RepID=A0A4Q7YBC6_9ACTN|nr:GTP-binding protein [Blastococcus saxobsidens]RZU33511.1 G3E family GTPase [Blastococcus saxobsidens]
MTDSFPRTPLVLVAGVDRAAVARAATAVLGDFPGAVLVHHDVSELSQGVAVRTVRFHGDDGVRTERAAVELAHGCLSCTLRLDLLPLLTDLAERDDVPRIVLQLDPTLEPEHLCWAIDNLLLDDTPRARASGQEEPVGASVEVEAVIATVDARAWLDDATGAAVLADRRLAATADDERTLAQVAIGQVAMADVVLLVGRPDDAWSAARLDAVLDRLVPDAVRADLGTWRPAEVLAGLGSAPGWSRCFTAHEPLLRGAPPLGQDAGVCLVRFGARRPFHPERLHDALDVLLEGVVCSRGRFWLASRHDSALWLESAGGGLRLGDAGPWLATFGDDPQRWADVDPERQVAASLRWDAEHGDRDVEIVVLVHRQPPGAVIAALDAALLTDEEYALGPSAWAELPDPFGSWHEEPCEAGSPADEDSTHATIREDRS